MQLAWYNWKSNIALLLSVHSVEITRATCKYDYFGVQYLNVGELEIWTQGCQS
ncbi:hypothetical protein M404DRAFT_998730 [Pisolithus tinctorius Marx 270]|uniref:Uncharacterized protein n=1 Tax=Pisolithus tinctorius Marx 270 TaxID=870435 RepID=A0A0C3KAD4_PISTI|nr:hypothetical protein M404DRAFT_998730 [Pisolithus tinctorius Marx 270]